MSRSSASPRDHVVSGLVSRPARFQLHAPSASISSTASYSSTDSTSSARVMYVMEFSIGVSHNCLASLCC